MTKKYVVVIVLVIFAGFVLFKMYTPQTDEKVSDVQSTGIVHQIVLGSEGFVPETLSVRVGDTVEFSSTNGKPFWPAANLHPSHRTYSEFDPKEPIEPGDTWSFMFDKVGEWKFHGHLAPYWGGIIKVSE